MKLSIWVARVSLPAILALSTLAACGSHYREITGHWQEIGAAATLDFREDGTFTAVDNQGMRVSGAYRLGEDGRVRFDIVHADGSTETIYGRADRRSDILSFTADDGGEIERYRRVP